MFEFLVMQLLLVLVIHF